MAGTRFFNKLKGVLSGQSRLEEVRLGRPYRLGHSKVRVPFEGVPIHVTLVKAGLELLVCPESLLDDSAIPSPQPFLLFDPERCQSGISGFLRLEKPGDTIILGHHDKLQATIFDYPATMDLRRLSICHDGDGLIFKALVSDSEIYLSPMSQGNAIERTLKRRRDNLSKVRALYGGAIEQLPPDDALATLRAVNEELEREPFRTLDDRGDRAAWSTFPGTSRQSS